MKQPLDVFLFARLGPYDKILLGPPCTLETPKKNTETCACFCCWVGKRQGSFVWMDKHSVYIYMINPYMTRKFSI